jgi:2-polyprenyl-6-methoxyphenol hydroxylase-like FAD-dependent oxidoreductase
MVLERNLSSKSLPGETLHPAAEAIFDELGVLASLLKHGFHRHRGIWREDAAGNRVFNAYGHDSRGPWMGFQIDRAKLNLALRERVIDLGGEISVVAHLDYVILENATVRGVSADGKLYHSQFVLDATGQKSWLAEELNLIPEQLTPVQKLRFGWTTQSFPDLDGQPLFKVRADGWDWVAPLGDGDCAWVKLRYTGTEGGSDYAWHIYRRCAGRGYFLLGDAACRIDPSAANGVLRALMSGIYAVHIINAVHCKLLPVEMAVAVYRRWVGEMADHTLSEYSRYGIWNRAG